LITLRDRIVLGSDFPNIPYPYVEQLAGLVWLDLGDDWLRAVLHDNAADLLRLSGSAPRRRQQDDQK
jgi:predicted TIM-barrel fold metal-dependent hydrolase